MTCSPSLHCPRVLGLSLALCLALVAAGGPLRAEEERPPVASSGPAAGRVRIGTWNIENLGRREPARTDADIAAIASFIRSTGVDVLALQEINGPAPLQRLVAALGPSYSFVLGTTGTFRGGQISVGFLWNTARVELLEAEELLELPSKTDGGDWIFHRKPVMASFRAREGGFDFRAVVVHLKAGRLNEGADWEKSVAKRVAEVKLLADHLTKLLERAGEDQDLVILGDFNSDPSYPAYKALSERFTYLRPLSKHRTIVYFDEQIDHLVVGKGLSEEIVPDSLRIWSELYDADPAAWKARYSDHIPLTLDLDASRDRDPDATFAPARAEQRLGPPR